MPRAVPPLFRFVPVVAALAGADRGPGRRRRATPPTGGTQASTGLEEGVGQADPARPRRARRRRDGSADPSRGPVASSAPTDLRVTGRVDAATIAALGLAQSRRAHARGRRPRATRRRSWPRSPSASPAAIRPRSPPTAATAASTSSRAPRGRRSAAKAIPPRPTRRPRTRWRSSSTKSAAPRPGRPARSSSTSPSAASRASRAGAPRAPGRPRRPRSPARSS